MEIQECMSKVCIFKQFHPEYGIEQNGNNQSGGGGLDIVASGIMVYTIHAYTNHLHRVSFMPLIQLGSSHAGMSGIWPWTTPKECRD